MAQLFCTVTMHLRAKSNKRKYCSDVKVKITKVNYPDGINRLKYISTKFKTFRNSWVWVWRFACWREYLSFAARSATDKVDEIQVTLALSEGFFFFFHCFLINLNLWPKPNTNDTLITAVPNTFPGAQTRTNTGSKRD